ncbi:MAG: hypothetical protein C4517_09315 [Stygiobacter sp.]|nr:MAG: hypothetical protein C4517_09315 [Stygiobacter sp.]
MKNELVIPRYIIGIPQTPAIILRGRQHFSFNTALNNISFRNSFKAREKLKQIFNDEKQN